MDRPLQILHLEDDPYDVELIEETLKAEGVACTIVHVNDREGFLAAVNQNGFDLILADFALPAFNGLEALALAQAKRPDIPFIFVSGAIGEEKAIESLKQGATDYVLKHRLSGLVPAITRTLREVEERTQRQQAEEQLRQSKNQLEAILSGITEGITVQLPDGTLIYANETAALSAGFPSAQALLEAPVSEFAQKFELRDEWNNPFPYSQLPGRIALQGQHPSEVLLQFHSHVNGEKRWAVVSATPIFDEQGQVQFAVNIFRDVTERTRLYQAEKEAREQMEVATIRIATLQLITGAFSQALTPEQVAQVVLEQGLAVLGATAGSIVLRNDEGTMLEVLHAAGYSPELLQAWRRFALDSPAPLAEAARTGEPIFLKSIEAAKRFPAIASQAEQSSHRSWASIPLLVEGRVIGVMGLSFTQPQLFADEERDFILALGQQCAQALDRARLYEAERIARAEAEVARYRLEFLAEASAILSSSLDYQVTLNKVAHLAVTRIADWCAVLLANAPSNPEPLVEPIVVVHTDPERVAWAYDLLRAHPLDPHAPIGPAAVLRTGQSELYPDFRGTLLAVTDVAVNEDILRQSGVHSLMIVPLSARERILGVLLLATAESERLLDTDDVALAEDLARRAALAVDNARLYWESARLNVELEERVRERTARLENSNQQLQEANTQLEEEIRERQRAEEGLHLQARRTAALVRTAARLNAELDLNKVLAAICEETARALDVATASVSLYDQHQDALVYAWGYGLPGTFHEQVQPFPRAAYEMYVQQMGPLVVTADVREMQGLPNLDLYKSLDVRSTASISMVQKEQLVGRLNVGSIGEIRHFSENDLALLQGLADQAAVAIQNARLLQEVRGSREQLRRLTQQLVNAQEDERQRLSRELHDELGQVLTVLKISLGLIQEDLPPDLPLMSKRIDEAVELTRDLMDQARVLAYDLRPPSLDPLGLNLTLESFCREFGQRTNLKIHYTGAEIPTLSEAVSITYYRLLQEALTNVARHAEAQEVEVALGYDGEKLKLLVSDNGQGFDVLRTLAVMGQPRGMGLLGMRERIELLGGSLEIDSKPGQGTRLTASILLQNEYKPQ